MRRIRLVFLLLAVLLLVPIGLLVQRALESVALERQVSHRAVAERLIDEMERELSRILRAEEERPFAHYRFDSFGDTVMGREGGGSASTLARSLAKRGYVPQDQAAKALLAEPNGSMRRLTLRYAQRLQLLEEADRNPQAEAFFEAGEFALRTVLDRRRPWTFELDPSTIPDETFGFWRMAQQLLVPYTVAGVIGGRGQHITMLEPAFQLGPAPFALSLAMQPWLQPRRNEAYFNNVLSLVWQRPWWPYISSLRIGGSLNGSWFGDRPEVDSCFGEDRYCAGVEASIGLFWEKLRIAGGALRLGRECDARGIFDAERGDCGDGYVSVGISDVRGFVYWLGRVLSE